MPDTPNSKLYNSLPNYQKLSILAMTTEKFVHYSWARIHISHFMTILKLLFCSCQHESGQKVEGKTGCYHDLDILFTENKAFLLKGFSLY